MSKSIANVVSVCLDQFDEISEAASLLQPQLLGLSGTINDERDRFSVYVRNIGAHQTDRRSLDFRLRDASHIRSQIFSLLQSMQESLQDAKNLVRDQDSFPKEFAEQDDMNHFSEIQDLFASIARTVTCLLRLSITIQNPAPHDRFALSDITDTSHFEAHDMEHTATKYPSSSRALAERLGKANSYRRQYFKYREARHIKMASVANYDPDGQSTEASSIAEQLKNQSNQEQDLPMIDEDKMSDGGLTQTSYATTVSGFDRPRVPPLPAASQDVAFECPFCFMMVSAHTRKSWKKHVFADLRPYICLFDDCQTPMKNFQRRRNWIEHVRQQHWRIWLCPLRCGESFDTERKLQKHMPTSHPDFQAPEGLIPELMQAASRPRREWTTVPCPLCAEEMRSVKHYQHHVGHHLEDVSLFALPHCEYATMETGHDFKTPGESSGSESGEERTPSRLTVYQSIPSYQLSRRNLAAALESFFPGEKTDIGSRVTDEFTVQLPRELTVEERKHIDSVRRAGDFEKNDDGPTSYWKVYEAEDFPLFLSAFGSDWAKIAAHMGTKTPVMIKNYYLRQTEDGKKEWEDRVREADAKRARGEKLPSLPAKFENFS
ncbi:hypothetical protein PFICI_08789 [Pestalotiopsis fici W106-1]|uniref:C2H2-type domain-containing protein n=1 Tax=Pestalotiopsis fici (strain W106-1 / CGMCC3.15140) TaxID=1229662 RepID=W3X193_PESFW|nr:uncharacterized protein PFICI_08789 [Pestalotiopsis fici W106-1]ETS78936.1 hypothetical protein PFICI_08789 [Pestalotiopsis fici W106-1]